MSAADRALAAGGAAHRLRRARAGNRGRALAGALLLALAGCAAEPAPPPPRPAQPATEAQGWERAPTPRIRTETVPNRFAPPAARSTLGWPDRYSGAPAGAPVQPRF